MTLHSHIRNTNEKLSLKALFYLRHVGDLCLVFTFRQLIVARLTNFREKLVQEHQFRKKNKLETRRVINKEDCCVVDKMIDFSESGAFLKCFCFDFWMNQL